MPFVDTHVHLHFPDYLTDRDEVLSRARATGIGTFINIGTDLESSRQAVRLAEEKEFIFASVGIHPHDTKDANALAFKELATLARHPRVVAIGEVGLDFFRGHSPHETQKEVFRRFLRLHCEIKKPLVLHCRDAYEDLMAILKEEMSPPFEGVMHCFSSDRAMMERFLDLGFHISFAGPLTYKKNDALREACKTCPIDRLLLETDAPFLAPQSMRGKRNEPAFMIETARVAAGLQGISLEELCLKTSENSRLAFKLAAAEA